MEVSLEEKAKELAKAADLSWTDVLRQLNELKEQGFSDMAAIIRWKSDNSFLLGRGQQDWTARLIAKEIPRKAEFANGQSMVSTFHLAVPNPMTEQIEFRQAGMWGQDRINDMDDIMEVGKVYKFTATEKGDGSLSRIRKVEEASDDLIPSLDEIEPLPMDRLPEAVGTNELIRGWVSRVIKIGNEPVAVDLADLGPSPPVTVWYGGQYSKIPKHQLVDIQTIGEDEEVCTYGYLSQSSADIRMNAVTVERVNQ